MIRTSNIHKTFGQLNVLNDISLEFKCPSFVGIIGPNGSGKTTLIKCILGLIKPDKGQLFFNEMDIKNSWSYREQISYLPQIAQFPKNLTVSELLAMLSNLRGTPDRSEELIDLFEIAPFIHKKFGALSGGMKQKVNLLTALMYNTPVIVLDEPTTGLDPMSQIKLKAYLLQEHKAGKCILITTHILSLLDQMCDTLLFLIEGSVRYFGDVESLKKSANTTSIEAAIPSLMETDVNNQGMNQQVRI